MVAAWGEKEEEKIGFSHRDAYKKGGERGKVGISPGKLERGRLGVGNVEQRSCHGQFVALTARRR